MRVAVAYACLAMASLYAPAYAQTAPVVEAPARLDTVYTKDGGLLRGTLVEVIPNDHVTIVLHDGSTTRLEWSAVDRVEPAVPATPPPAAPVTIVPSNPQPLPNASAPMTGPTVLVHLVAPRGATLDRKEKDADTWVWACEAPCDVSLPLNNEYRVAGPGFHASSTFELEASPGQRVTVTVSPGSKTLKMVGLVVSGIGVNAMVAGLLIVALASATEGSHPCGPVDPEFRVQTQFCPDDHSGGRTVGWIVFGTGLALGAGGGLLAWLNWKTGVSQAAP